MSTSSGRKRLRFDRVEVKEEADGKCSVRVTLTLGEYVVHAEATDDAAAGPLRAASEATLKAVQEAASNRFTCTLSDLDHVKALGKDLIAVLVDIKFQGQDVQVFGSCQIAGSEIDCAVKSTLNATNRMFELAMRS